jgi:predicted dehydrogenase
MLVGMSIHHLDQFRYLFGDPVEVTAITSKYPKQPWHGESIAFYCLRYESGLIACGLDDGFPWLPDWSATFRVEGTGAIARGKFGWTAGGPSSLDYVLADDPSVIHDAQLTLKWFPDAFRGTMGSLFNYITTGVEPDISARNNLGTMRLVEACYLSAAEKRTVQMKEISS